MGGKIAMKRSEKPFFKKEKENTRVLTQSQEDYLKYMGELPNNGLLPKQ